MSEFDVYSNDKCEQCISMRVNQFAEIAVQKGMEEKNNTDARFLQGCIYKCIVKPLWEKLFSMGNY